jgi:hypothetical protein
MMPVSIKDVRKGTRVVLKNGWVADVMDNKVTSQTRFCKVYGTYTELGSVYSTDIQSVEVNGGWVAVEHTPSQRKAAGVRSAWGF